MLKHRVNAEMLAANIKSNSMFYRMNPLNTNSVKKLVLKNTLKTHY